MTRPPATLAGVGLFPPHFEAFARLVDVGESSRHDEMTERLRVPLNEVASMATTIDNRLPRLGIRLPQPTVDHLQALAKRRGMSVAALIRSLIAVGLAHDEPEEQR